MESWWPLSAWLSPGAVMFLFFNVLVGAVAVMSRGQKGQQRRRLCRSASSMVLGRLQSFSSLFSTVNPAAEWYGDYPTAAEEEELHVAEPPPEQAVLEPAAAEPPHAPAVTAAAADAPPASMPAEEKCASSNAAAEPSPPAASATDEATATAVEGARKEQPAAKEVPTESSTSKRRARACRRGAEEALEGKAELNARAELFINQFKEDLKLQRLNSILNYTRALHRRAGAALSSQE